MLEKLPSIFLVHICLFLCLSDHAVENMSKRSGHSDAVSGDVELYNAPVRQNHQWIEHTGFDVCGDFVQSSNQPCDIEKLS